MCMVLLDIDLPFYCPNMTCQVEKTSGMKWIGFGEEATDSVEGMKKFGSEVGCEVFPPS